MTTLLASVTVGRSVAFTSVLLVGLGIRVIASGWSSWQLSQDVFLLLQFFAVLLLAVVCAPKEKRALFVVSWVGFSGSLAMWLRLTEVQDTESSQAIADVSIVAVGMMAFFVIVCGYVVFVYMPVLIHKAKTRAESENESSNPNRP